MPEFINIADLVFSPKIPDALFERELERVMKKVRSVETPTKLKLEQKELDTLAQRIKGGNNSTPVKLKLESSEEAKFKARIEGVRATVSTLARLGAGEEAKLQKAIGNIRASILVSTSLTQAERDALKKLLEGVTAQLSVRAKLEAADAAKLTTQLERVKATVMVGLKYSSADESKIQQAVGRIKATIPVTLELSATERGKLKALTIPQMPVTLEPTSYARSKKQLEDLRDILTGITLPGGSGRGGSGGARANNPAAAELSLYTAQQKAGLLTMDQYIAKLSDLRTRQEAEANTLRSLGVLTAQQQSQLTALDTATARLTTSITRLNAENSAQVQAARSQAQMLTQLQNDRAMGIRTNAQYAQGLQTLIAVSRVEIGVLQAQAAAARAAGQATHAQDLAIRELEATARRAAGSLRGLQGASGGPGLGGNILSALSASGVGGSVAQVGNLVTSLGGIPPLAIGIAAVGVAVLGIGAAAVSSMNDYGEFEARMKGVKAVTQASQGEYEKLSSMALELGSKSKFSANEIAGAMEELGKAGISTNNILSGAADGVRLLAEATGTDLYNAASIAAKSMNIFNLTGAEMGRVADVITNGANKTALDVDTLGVALQQVGNSAAGAGLSIEETTAFLGMMADKGIAGSDAGTSLKVALQRLQAPTREVSKELERMGISVFDTQGRQRDMITVLGELIGKMGTMTDEQRKGTAQTIFGSDAIRTIEVLYSKGAVSLGEYIDKMSESGSAFANQQTRMEGLKGAQTRFNSALEGFKIKWGESFAPIGIWLADTGSKFLNWLGDVSAKLTGLDFSKLAEAFPTLKKKMDELNAEPLPAQGEGRTGALLARQQAADAVATNLKAQIKVIEDQTGYKTMGRPAPSEVVRLTKELAQAEKTVVETGKQLEFLLKYDEKALSTAAGKKILSGFDSSVKGATLGKGVLSGVAGGGKYLQTQDFGDNPQNPAYKGVINGANGHNGIDLVLPGGMNADVRSSIAGKVKFKLNDRWLGNYATITDSIGNQLILAHLSKVNMDLNGVAIRAGEIIGKQGNTGNTSNKTRGGRGIHVHVGARTPDGLTADPSRVEFVTDVSALPKVAPKGTGNYDKELTEAAQRYDQARVKLEAFQKAPASEKRTSEILRLNGVLEQLKAKFPEIDQVAGGGPGAEKLSARVKNIGKDYDNLYRKVEALKNQAATDPGSVDPSSFRALARQAGQLKAAEKNPTGNRALAFGDLQESAVKEAVRLQKVRVEASRQADTDIRSSAENTAQSVTDTLRNGAKNTIATYETRSSAIQQMVKRDGETEVAFSQRQAGAKVALEREMGQKVKAAQDSLDKADYQDTVRRETERTRVAKEGLQKQLENTTLSGAKRKELQDALGAEDLALERKLGGAKDTLRRAYEQNALKSSETLSSVTKASTEAQKQAEEKLAQTRKNLSQGKLEDARTGAQTVIEAQQLELTAAQGNGAKMLEIAQRTGKGVYQAKVILAEVNKKTAYQQADDEYKASQKGAADNQLLLSRRLTADKAYDLALKTASLERTQALETAEDKLSSARAALRSKELELAKSTAGLVIAAQQSELTAAEGNLTKKLEIERRTGGAVLEAKKIQAQAALEEARRSANESLKTALDSGVKEVDAKRVQSAAYVLADKQFKVTLKQADLERESGLRNAQSAVSDEVSKLKKRYIEATSSAQNLAREGKFDSSAAKNLVVALNDISRDAKKAGLDTNTVITAAQGIGYAFVSSGQDVSKSVNEYNAKISSIEGALDKVSDKRLKEIAEMAQVEKNRDLLEKVLGELEKRGLRIPLSIDTAGIDGFLDTWSKRLEELGKSFAQNSKTQLPADTFKPIQTFLEGLDISKLTEGQTAQLQGFKPLLENLRGYSSEAEALYTRISSILKIVGDPEQAALDLTQNVSDSALSTASSLEKTVSGLFSSLSTDFEALEDTLGKAETTLAGLLGGMDGYSEDTQGAVSLIADGVKGDISLLREVQTDLVNASSGLTAETDKAVAKYLERGKKENNPLFTQIAELLNSKISSFEGPQIGDNLQGRGIGEEADALNTLGEQAEVSSDQVDALGAALEGLSEAALKLDLSSLEKLGLGDSQQAQMIRDELERRAQVVAGIRSQNILSSASTVPTQTDGYTATADGGMEFTGMEDIPDPEVAEANLDERLAKMARDVKSFFEGDLTAVVRDGLALTDAQIQGQFGADNISTFKAALDEKVKEYIQARMEVATRMYAALEQMYSPGSFGAAPEAGNLSPSSDYTQTPDGGMEFVPNDAPEPPDFQAIEDDFKDKLGRLKELSDAELGDLAFDIPLQIKVSDADLAQIMEEIQTRLEGLADSSPVNLTEAGYQNTQKRVQGELSNLYSGKGSKVSFENERDAVLLPELRGMLENDAYAAFSDNIKNLIAQLEGALDPIKQIQGAEKELGLVTDELENPFKTQIDLLEQLKIDYPELAGRIQIVIDAYTRLGQAQLAQRGVDAGVTLAGARQSRLEQRNPYAALAGQDGGMGAALEASRKYYDGELEAAQKNLEGKVEGTVRYEEALSRVITATEKLSQIEKAQADQSVKAWSQLSSLVSQAGNILSTVGGVGGKTLANLANSAVSLGTNLTKALASGGADIGAVIGAVGDAVNFIGELGQAILDNDPAYAAWKKNLMDVLKLEVEALNASVQLAKYSGQQIFKFAGQAKLDKDATDRNTLANAGFWQKLGWDLFGGAPKVLDAEAAKSLAQTKQIFTDFGSSVANTFTSTLVQAFQSGKPGQFRKAFQQAIRAKYIEMIVTMMSEAALANSEMGPLLNKFAEQFSGYMDALAGGDTAKAESYKAGMKETFSKIESEGLKAAQKVIKAGNDAGLLELVSSGEVSWIDAYWAKVTSAYEYGANAAADRMLDKTYDIFSELGQGLESALNDSLSSAFLNGDMGSFAENFEKTFNDQVVKMVIKQMVAGALATADLAPDLQALSNAIANGNWEAVPGIVQRIMAKGKSVGGSVASSLGSSGMLSGSMGYASNKKADRNKEITDRMGQILDLQDAKEAETDPTKLKEIDAQLIQLEDEVKFLRGGGVILPTAGGSSSASLSGPAASVSIDQASSPVVFYDALGTLATNMQTYFPMFAEGARDIKAAAQLLLDSAGRGTQPPPTAAPKTDYTSHY